MAASAMGRPILVVDDDAEIRETLHDLLLETGHAIFTAANGQEALAVLGQIPRPCVVLLDLMMPVMDGTELLRRLRETEATASLKVVLVTASDRIPAGANAFLKKPFSIHSLLAVVKQHCD